MMDAIPRRWLRGLGWLVVALAAFWSLDHLAWTGLSEYSIRSLGALAKCAACVFGGYRVSRDVLRIDPSEASTDVGYGMRQLARALLIGLFAVAVCVSV